jgi:hypothetical protein
MSGTQVGLAFWHIWRKGAKMRKFGLSLIIVLAGVILVGVGSGQATRRTVLLEQAVNAGCG